MSENSERIRKVYEVHAKDDRALELASSLDMGVDQFASAKMLQMKVEDSPHWLSQRSPHGLMVDCIYLVAKRSGMKISAVKMSKHTKEIFGIGTQPRPSAWQNEFMDLIEEYA